VLEDNHGGYRDDQQTCTTTATTRTPRTWRVRCAMTEC